MILKRLRGAPLQFHYRPDLGAVVFQERCQQMDRLENRRAMLRRHGIRTGKDPAHQATSPEPLLRRVFLFSRNDVTTQAPSHPGGIESRITKAAIQSLGPLGLALDLLVIERGSLREDLRNLELRQLEQAEKKMLGLQNGRLQMPCLQFRETPGD